MHRCRHGTVLALSDRSRNPKRLDHKYEIMSWIAYRHQVEVNCEGALQMRRQWELAEDLCNVEWTVEDSHVLRGLIDYVVTLVAVDFHGIAKGTVIT